MGQPCYITTPIYYVTDAPHIGHAYTTIAADVLARWRRSWGDDVRFLTGTDEHGLKVQRAAEQAGHTPQQHADLTSARYREAWQLLGITNDDFIRTTEDRHTEAVQAFLQKVKDNGDIELDTYEGWYNVSDEAYVAADEVVDGKDASGRPVEWVTERNWFFRLSRYTQRLLDHYEAHPEAIEPEGRRNEVLGFIRGGLRDFSISRSTLSWGIPIPWDPEQVTYVWYDALINYCTAVGYAGDRATFDRYWPSALHVVGKDILRFHAVFWPAMLMAAGEEPPRKVFAHGWLLVGGEKMSKSRLNAISPASLVEDFGVDGFRYHFMADQRFGPDGDFSYEAMVARYNADLANNFGNLASRVLNMAANYLGGVTPDARDDVLRPVAEAAFAGLGAGIDRLDFAGGLASLWDLVRATNAYIEDRAPWALHKAGDAPAVAAVLGDCLEALRLIALGAAPVIPTAAAELWRRLGLAGSPGDQRLPDAATWGGLPAGLPLEKGPALFPRLEQ